MEVLYVAIQLHYIGLQSSDLVIKVSACHIKNVPTVQRYLASNIKTNNLVVSNFLGSLVDGSIVYEHLLCME